MIKKSIRSVYLLSVNKLLLYATWGLAASKVLIRSKIQENSPSDGWVICAWISSGDKHKERARIASKRQTLNVDISKAS